MWDAGRDLFLGGACVGCDRPGRPLCRPCEAALPRGGVPAWPTPTPPGLATPMAGGPYDGVLKAMVNAHKEHAVLALAAPLGDVLALVVADLAAAVAPGRPVALVPVPVAPVGGAHPRPRPDAAGRPAGRRHAAPPGRSRRRSGRCW